ncbi:hypothetical protein Tco_0219110 [Tanacetum coccineum]
MEDDDDDIGDLDDYLIPNDASCYVDEEEERFKERRSKLLGIPYKNHQRSNLKIRGFNMVYPSPWIRRIDPHV